MNLLRRLTPLLLLILSCGDDGGTGSDTTTSTSTTTTDTTTTAGTTTTTSTTTDTTSEGTTTAPPTSGTDGAGSTSTSTSTTGASTTDEPSSTTTGSGATRVTFETTMGSIVIELDEELAPVTSANFLAYVNAGFYDGKDQDGETIFHRVLPGFVIQGGGLREDLSSKPTMPPIVNEFGNGLLNLRGTISMARTQEPNSATSQFFINLVDNDNLDIPPGYAVFGEVVEGMTVVDSIAQVQTGSMGQYDDVPLMPILITSATVSP